jgi:hypothetical protein
MLCKPSYVNSLARSINIIRRTCEETPGGRPEVPRWSPKGTPSEETLRNSVFGCALIGRACRFIDSLEEELIG